MYKFIKDSKVSYVVRNGFVFSVGNKLVRKTDKDIENFYKSPKYPKPNLYNLVQNTIRDCEKYIATHTVDDYEEDILQMNYNVDDFAFERNEIENEQMTKKEYINYLITEEGYSDVDAEEKANSIYDTELIEDASGVMPTSKSNTYTVKADPNRWSIEGGKSAPKINQGITLGSLFPTEEIAKNAYNYFKTNGLRIYAESKEPNYLEYATEKQLAKINEYLGESFDTLKHNEERQAKIFQQQEARSQENYGSYIQKIKNLDESISYQTKYNFNGKLVTLGNYRDPEIAKAAQEEFRKITLSTDDPVEALIKFKQTEFYKIYEESKSDIFADRTKRGNVTKHSRREEGIEHNNVYMKKNQPRYATDIDTNNKTGVVYRSLGDDVGYFRAQIIVSYINTNVNVYARNYLQEANNDYAEAERLAWNDAVELRNLLLEDNELKRLSLEENSRENRKEIISRVKELILNNIDNQETQKEVIKTIENEFENDTSTWDSPKYNFEKIKDSKINDSLEEVINKFSKEATANDLRDRCKIIIYINEADNLGKAKFNWFYEKYNREMTGTNFARNNGIHEYGKLNYKKQFTSDDYFAANEKELDNQLNRILKSYLNDNNYTIIFEKI